uniref:transmembrane protein 126A-like isoform X1 n=2 Tax=Myxine glutinosa TaxID=7769 RepID=UPI00358FBB36
MSIVAEKNAETELTSINKTDLLVQLYEVMEQMPFEESSVFTKGPYLFGANAGMVGLIGNSLCRRLFRVRQAKFQSLVTMSTLPFLVTTPAYFHAISIPLLTGSLSSKNEAMVRGGTIAVLCSGLLPLALALPLNIMLAKRFGTVRLPEQGKWAVWGSVLRPLLIQMSAVGLMQCAFAVYLASEQFRVNNKVQEMYLQPKSWAQTTD